MFNDEFVRHKMLDIVGDIVLAGMPIKAHIVAVRPGHALNAELSKELRKKILEKAKGAKKKASMAAAPQVDGTETSMDIRRVLDLLPHRYPFVMIDRVLEIVSQDERGSKTSRSTNPIFKGTTRRPGMLASGRPR